MHISPDAAIKNAIDNTPSLRQFPIRVHIKDGIVTLHGTVPSDSHRRAAGDAIKPLSGIQGVINCISVFPAAS
jgi:osmotically-inducible protein OsmY